MIAQRKGTSPAGQVVGVPSPGGVLGGGTVVAAPLAAAGGIAAGGGQADAKASPANAPTPAPIDPGGTTFISPAVTTPSASQDVAALASDYGQAPLSFEANLGQADPRVRFLSRGGASTLFLTSTEAVLSLQAPGSSAQDPSAPAGVVLRMGLVGANPSPHVVGADELPGKVNSFQGDDPAAWITDITTFARVEERGVYDGIDLVYYGNGHRLEYDFVVAPGADPSAIRLSFRGDDGAEIDPAGDLVLHTAVGDVVQQAPVLYQAIDGVRHVVAGGYVLDGDHVGFRVGAYDATRPLVIDPVLSYSTYLGGNGFDQAYGIAVDGAGNAYVAGRSDTTDFPTTAGAFQRANPNAAIQGFVTKLDPAGRPVYSTYFPAAPNDIAVDSAGNAYITGGAGPGFPTTPGAYRATPILGGDAFVAKLNPTGSGLVYSTFFGGDGDEAGHGIAVDSAGNAVVTGTVSIRGPYTFPTVNAFQPAYGGGNNDAFAFKLNAAGSGLVYSTFLGGGSILNTTDDWGEGVAVDAAGNAYVTGTTNAQDFPTTPGAFLTRGGGSFDSFVTKLTPAGAAAYSTFLGSVYGHEESFGGIAVDTGGNAYVTGYTDAWDSPFTAANEGFPTTPGAFQSNLVGQWDAFVTKLNPSGSGLVYSTYLGGSDNGSGGALAGTDRGWDIAVDSAGYAYVTGDTGSVNFPTFQPVQAAYGGGFHDVFVTKMNPTGSAPAFSTYLGGQLDDQGEAIAVDSAGNAYVAGATDSFNFPTTAGALRPQNGGGLEHHDDGFAAKITGLGAATNWLNTLALNPALVAGGQSSQGTVTINAAAPAGGAVVTLSNGRPDLATVPASVIVPAGATTASFAISTASSLGGWTGRAGTLITATFGGVSRSQTLEIDITDAGPAASAMSLSPATVTGGATSTATITLTAPAPAGGAVVGLASDNTAAATVPASVTVPAGATSASFTVTTRAVATTAPAAITASFGGALASATLTVTPAATAVSVASLGLNPASVVGGNSSTGTVTLSGAAPAGGTVVTLASSNTGAATVPASVTVPAGATSTTFSIATKTVSAGTAVTISAAQGGVTKTAVLTVNPSTPADTVSVSRAEYTASQKQLRVEATSTNGSAVLKVYVTSTGALIGTLTNNGGGKYGGQFALSTNPQNVTIRSSLGGSATRAVTLK